MQIGVAGHPNGLGPEDTKDLWAQADIDGKGALDYEEFLVSIKDISFNDT